jgi:hypothetical protein
MASEKVMRGFVCLAFFLVICETADAYMMQGLDIVVDYWAGVGNNETTVVIDWNRTNGPYVTESHAWGFRWDGDAYVSDALAAIDAAGALNVVTLYGGDFVGDAFYYDPSINSDNHTTAGYTGWWWVGGTTDGGVTWNATGAGLTAELLNDGKIEGLNSVMNFDEWLAGGSTLTIPVPEPGTLAFLALGGALFRKHKGWLKMLGKK